MDSNDFYRAASKAIDIGVIPAIERKKREDARKKRAETLGNQYISLFENADPVKARIAADLATQGINVSPSVFQKQERPDIGFMNAPDVVKQAYDVGAINVEDALKFTLQQKKANGEDLTEAQAIKAWKIFPKLQKLFPTDEMGPGWEKMIALKNLKGWIGTQYVEQLDPLGLQGKGADSRIVRIFRDISSGKYQDLTEFAQKNPDDYAVLTSDKDITTQELKEFFAPATDAFGGVSYDTAITKVMSIHNTERSNLFGNTNFLAAFSDMEPKDTFLPDLKDWQAGAIIDPAKKAFFDKYYSKSGQLSPIKLQRAAKELFDPINEINLPPDDLELLETALNLNMKAITPADQEKIIQEYKDKGKTMPKYNFDKINELLKELEGYGG